jgi:hypothetical protein
MGPLRRFPGCLAPIPARPSSSSLVPERRQLIANPELDQRPHGRDDAKAAGVGL